MEGKEIVWTDHISIPVLSMCGAKTNVSRTDSVRLPVPPRIHLVSLHRPARRDSASRRPLRANCLLRNSSPLPGLATVEGGGEAKRALLREDTEASATPPPAPHLAAQALNAASPI